MIFLTLFPSIYYVKKKKAIKLQLPVNSVADSSLSVQTVVCINNVSAKAKGI